MPEVLVTSQQSGRFVYSRGTETVVLKRDEITSLHADTIPELLNALSSIDILERGTPGSQADTSIRGSSNEGVLVLVNGTKIHDPQTGHFTLDMPVDLSAVERIEVLRGGGSTMYGSTAVGGVINIITRNDFTGINGKISVGSFGTIETAAGLGFSNNGSNISCHIRNGKSDGYTQGTDLEYTGVDMLGSFHTEASKIDWNAGLLNKQFGAAGFYSPYPSFEKTMTLLGGITVQRVINSHSIVRARAGARGHGDDFILERNNPDFYRNTHYNRSLVFSGEYAVALGGKYSVVTGVETERTGISSGNLGTHADMNNALYGEFTADAKKAEVSVSLRYDRGFRKENCFTQGAGITVPLGISDRFRLRAEKSFRSPTYTELYYSSPANRGNPALKSEHARSIEAGFEHAGSPIFLGITMFARESTNVIDWIRGVGETVWRAENHGRVGTAGVEMNARTSIAQNWVCRVSAMFLNQSVKQKKGVESKYVLNPPGRTVTGIVTGVLPAEVHCSFMVRYEEKLHGDIQVPVTVSCSRVVKKIKAVVSVHNALNDRYEEIPDLPAPERWYTLRLEYNQ